MIYTITFNPALDYIMNTGDINLGKTNRSNFEEIVYGGKGINVSVMLSNLGVENTAIAFAAGFTGKELERALKSKNINTDFIYIKNGLTRINVKLPFVDTEINASGPEIDFEALNEFYQKLNVLKDDDILVLAGSIPKTLPENIYEEIMEKLQNKNIKIIVDAEGTLLLNTLKYKPFLIKPNIDELSAIFNKKLENEDDIIKAAKALIEKGAKNVIVSMGDKGAYLVSENGEIYKENAHKITVASAVGAGDSMVAGFIKGIETSLKYALKLGSAAGAATASVNGIADGEKVLELLGE